MRKVLTAVAVAMIGVYSGPVMADTSPKDIAIAGRVLGVLQTPLSGDVRVGIVFSPAKADSTKDEQALAAILGSGLKAGNATLHPVPVELDKLDGAAVDVIILTAGLGTDGATAGAYAQSKKILCLTTDLAATKAGYCAVSIQSDPKVQITVNRAAAEASGAAFSAAFKMMVTEI